MTVPHTDNTQVLTLSNAPAFIEVQFPVSKLSKESYNERKANVGQTLTALGKWWGRKPLVLVRAAILGLLLPATDEPEKDREVFLALMTMDDGGLLRRLEVSIPQAVVYQYATPREREQYLRLDERGKPKWKKKLPKPDRQRMQELVYRRMSYDEKLKYASRPEEIDGPGPAAWTRINAHLGTQAASLAELVRELGVRRFGHTPRVGDAFCGGGSIPFEAARIGCDAYGSDLSPVAALLTWGALNIVGGGKEVVERVQAAQRRVYGAVKNQVDKWGIERNEDGWIADAYLYCNEVIDPVTGWRVPLAPSWVVGEGTRTVARLVPIPEERRFDIVIKEGATDEELEAARREGTAKDGIRCPVDAEGNWLSPNLRTSTSFRQLLGSQGLRLWGNHDIIPQRNDVFQERLYCIRWVDQDNEVRHYASPTETDLKREAHVYELIAERMVGWQSKGHLPQVKIIPGEKTGEPIRARGWTYWHHLYNPRQLLIGGVMAELIDQEDIGEVERAALLLSLARVANMNSRLCIWDSSSGREEGKLAFYNQAINPLVNYSCRPSRRLETFFCMDLNGTPLYGNSTALPLDARITSNSNDLWITDPGYADAISYEEISEYFLTWYDRIITITGGEVRA